MCKGGRKERDGDLPCPDSRSIADGMPYISDQSITPIRNGKANPPRLPENRNEATTLPSSCLLRGYRFSNNEPQLAKPVLRVLNRHPRIVQRRLDVS